MDREELVNVLNTFANWPSAFTIEEIRTYLDSEIGDEILCNEFVKDKRFILLESNTPKKQYFLSKATLFQWLCNFNIRLAKIKKFRLNEHQLSSAISSLRRNGQWDIPPAKVIQWGLRYGLIGNAWTDSYYVFPLAQALSFMHPSSLSIVAGVFKDFYEKQIWKISLTKLRKETMQSGFSQFHPRISYVIQAREGFQTGVKMTLEQVGADFGVTRERVRQIERKFWNELKVERQKRQQKLKQKPFTWDFIAAWLADFMTEQGSLVVSKEDPKLHIRKFLAKCAGIPMVKLM